MMQRADFLHRSWLVAVLSCGFCFAAGAGAALAGVSLATLPRGWQDDNGKPISMTDLAGHRVVLTMAYASCHRICPMTMERLKLLQAALDSTREDVEFVIVGYDPENDGPAAWRHYRRTHKLGRANWHFLTGSLADTTQLARQLHFELWKYDEHVMHGSRVLVFDGHGSLTGEFGPETDLSSVLQ